MAAVWYGLAGVQNPSPQAIQWWTKQIQQDGSQPAFDNFKNGKGQDAQDKFDPNVLAQNAAKYTAATKLQPFQPSANVPQFPGTNHKTLIAEAQEPVGNFLKNIAPIAALIPGVGPLVSGALAAAGQAIIPGANLGDAVKAGAVGAAEGAGVGALGSATGLTGGVNSLLGGGASSASSAPIDLSGMTPEQMAAVGDASAGTAADTSGADMLGGLTGKALASTANAGGGATLPGASTVAGLAGKVAGGGSSPSSGGGILDFLTGNNGLNALGIAQGVNAAQLGEKANNYADQAANLATSRWNAQQPLRTAGVAGMLNPVSPITPPAMPGGNPFAMPQPAPVTPPKVGS